MLKELYKSIDMKLEGWMSHLSYELYGSRYEVIEIKETHTGLDLILKLKDAFIAYKDIQFSNKRLEYKVAFFSKSLNQLQETACLLKIAKDILYKIYFTENETVKPILASLMVCAVLTTTNINLQKGNVPFHYQSLLNDN